MGRWEGQTVVCIASGPSLTKTDCNKVEASGLPTVAVNTSWELARFCEVIYAGDLRWWENNHHKIDIQADRVTCSQAASHLYGARFHKLMKASNSGSRAIEFALEAGASKIILLGYDCSIKHGIHWHGKHENSSNPDEGRCALWQEQFANVLIAHPDAEIINCSRETALKCFSRDALQNQIGN